jgi:hypothetical protein
MSLAEMPKEKMMIMMIMSEDKMPEYVKFSVKMEIDKMIRFLHTK